MTTQEILEAARAARSALGLSSGEVRRAALLGMAEALCSPARQQAILDANAADLEAARGHISEVMLDRLALTPERISAMAKGIREVAALPDPVGKVLRRVERPNGLVIEKTAVPMGVIAIIRPCHLERQCLHPAVRQGGMAQCQRHCSGSAGGSADKRPARNSGLPDRGHHPRLGQRPDDGGGLCGSAHPARRGRTHPRLCGKCKSPLHPDRHRHLPHLRGCFCRAG